jgi:hypothetical protein
MANEKRLIDANALIAEYDRVHIGEPGKARKLMEDAPTVDAVEVVRCKDCKHYYYSAYAMRCVCDFDNKEWDKDDFCSYGERRTE